MCYIINACIMKWEDIYRKASQIVSKFIGQQGIKSDAHDLSHDRQVQSHDRQGQSHDTQGQLDDRQVLSHDTQGQPDNTESTFEELLRDSNAIYNSLSERERFDYMRAFIKLNRRIRIRSVIRKSVPAAAAAIFVGMVIYGGYMVIESNKQQISTESVAMAQIKPGEKRARLILADGSEVSLQNADSKLVQDNGTLIKIDSDGVRYENDGAVRDGQGEEIKKDVYNTLEVPRGGEYSLILADGTKVWLNSDSKLSYPVSFVEDRRVVFLEGEAYFEVKNNRNKPFIVNTISGEVTVLGTSFNVKGYKEDMRLYTTLVEGSVSFRATDASKGTTLIPGQQLFYNIETGSSELLSVNVNNYISWKDNMFKFQEQSLEEIMKILSRWYDVTVTFESADIRQLQFSGNLDKYSTIDSFFKLFEAGAKIEFLIENNRVHIKRRL